MIVILLGPPGAGKGTQAERIAKHYFLNHLSTGDLLRSAVTKGTDLGILAKDFMNSGKLVPDDVILGIIKDYMIEQEGKGILFDGFPRTVAQADGLSNMLKGKSSVAVVLEVPDQIVIDRLSSRRVCRSCGKIYNLALGIMPKGNKCDCVGDGELYQRDDDKSETIANRLSVYHNQTEPIVEFYGKNGTLKKINGSGHPDEIFKNISTELG